MRTWKHTQEQWWIDDDGFIAAGHDDSYVTLADPHCSLDIDPDEREANSILMMLSPRMLSALVSAEDALSAAWSAAWNAARNAAESAARNAAWSAERNAAWNAERKAQRRKFKQLVKEEFANAS